ncbi:redoxin [Apodospora peruviana]|uniref:Redoxin n=1 Tax=Apodospora peruviana TaxID=516989 RepID=A0AAE0M7Q1_9PEZI|nr:redoxin [Apodospora peruviana]
MSFRTVTMRLRSQPMMTRLATPSAAARSFHSTRPAFIKVGDPLPDLDVLMEDTPGHKVNLAEEAKKSNNMILLGVPAAFSGSCSQKHIPSYINHPKTKEFDTVAVVSVNDVFVMKAWAEALNPGNQYNIRFLADPTGRFTKALDLAFDGSAIFGGDRSKRYAIIVEDGKVKSVAVEPDNTGTNVSMADKVLG